MEIIILSGGLGNQMFQYAFFLAKRQKGENVSLNSYSLLKEATHNGYELKRLFGIEAENLSPLSLKTIRKLLIFQNKKNYKLIATTLLSLLRLCKINYVREEGYSLFNEKYLSPSLKNTFYFGFWQSPKYFESFSKKLRNVFSFEKLPLSKKSNSLLKTIQKPESVSIHIRRGDYLSEENKNTYGNICTKNYYQKAISIIEREIKDPLYIIFSDDPEWVKNNLSLNNAIVVDWNSGENSWEDLFLMSMCQHNIIANSTFSWWGAWLNKNPQKKVFAPSKFMNRNETPDLYPPEWIIIDCV